MSNTGLFFCLNRNCDQKEKIINKDSQKNHQTCKTVSCVEILKDIEDNKPFINDLVINLNNNIEKTLDEMIDTLTELKSALKQNLIGQDFKKIIDYLRQMQLKEIFDDYQTFLQLYYIEKEDLIINKNIFENLGQFKEQFQTLLQNLFKEQQQTIIQKSLISTGIKKVDQNKVKVEYNKQTETIDIQPSETILRLKELLVSKFNLSIDEQLIIYNKKELLNPLKIENCNILSDQSLTLYKKILNFEVRVRTKQAKQYILNVNNEMTIREMKQQFLDVTEKNDDIRRIIFSIDNSNKNQDNTNKEVILEDDKKIKEYNLVDNHIIKMNQKIDTDINIKVQVGHQELLFTVKNNLTILEFKQLIQQRMNYKIEQQSLRYNNVQLDNTKTLEECDIQNNSQLKLILRLITVQQQ